MSDIILFNLLAAGLTIFLALHSLLHLFSLSSPGTRTRATSFPPDPFPPLPPFPPPQGSTAPRSTTIGADPANTLMRTATRIGENGQEERRAEERRGEERAPNSRHSLTTPSLLPLATTATAGGEMAITIGESGPKLKEFTRRHTIY